VIVWDNLTVNQTYTLAEATPTGGWQAGAPVCTVNGNSAADADPNTPGFQIAVTAGADVRCTVTNTLPPGVITLTKAVIGTTGDWSFNFTLNGIEQRTVTQANPVATWTNLDANQTYTLAEVNPGAGWQTATPSCTINGDPVTDADPNTAGLQILVTPGSSISCLATNTALPGKITVTKVVTQTNETTWSFIFRLDGASPQAVTPESPTVAWSDLAPGQTYVVSEDTPNDDWTEGLWVCSVNGVAVGELLPSGAVSIPVNAGDNVVCLKYNTDVSGTGLDPAPEPETLVNQLYLPSIRK
jgi:hypothetical protein